MGYFRYAPRACSIVLTDPPWLLGGSVSGQSDWQEGVERTTRNNQGRGAAQTNTLGQGPETTFEPTGDDMVLAHGLAGSACHRHIRPDAHYGGRGQINWDSRGPRAPTGAAKNRSACSALGLPMSLRWQNLGKVRTELVGLNRCGHSDSHQPNMRQSTTKPEGMMLCSLEVGHSIFTCSHVYYLWQSSRTWNSFLLFFLSSRVVSTRNCAT